MKKTTTRVEGVILRETARAFFVTLNGVTDSVWIAKSQLTALNVTEEDLNDGLKPIRYIGTDIPVWLWNKLPLNQVTVQGTKPW